MEHYKDARGKGVERTELERTNAYALSLLKDKRRLNAELESERKLSRKLKEECYDLRRRLRERETTGSESAACSNVNSLVSASEESRADDLADKIEALENSLRESRAQIISLEDHKTVLESEILRLAEELGKDDSCSDLELYVEQLSIYENDFQKEKNDKEQAESKVSALTDQITDCQELISTLTREVDLYKNAFERERKDKEMALMRERPEGTLLNLPTYSQSGMPNFPGNISGDQTRLALPVPAPHLQVVYPIVDSGIQQQDSKRKRELHRRGVLTRDTPDTTDFGYHS
ncbi:hypothetical protein OS493_018449 [Desmophyllum pertusum]|uniref:Uncharacterized protein n=1 Tax=Desmophyllum pertusum TaxID=174260 RepID=A0A9X0A1P8_9CNID|nr:hypothetical protein OS493_018449 [Desmophyllum pertusum]